MLKKYQHLFNKDRSFLILCSKPIDMDSLGSGIVLKKYLESLGKSCSLIFPRSFTEEERLKNKDLPYLDEIEDQDTREIFREKKYDCLILLDGTSLVQYYDTDIDTNNPPTLKIYPQRIRIDHHEGNPEKIATINIHNKKSSSTMEVLLTKIVPIKFLNKNLATLAYAALVGDTGNFQWNFFPSTLKIAGLLQARDANWEFGC